MAASENSAETHFGASQRGRSFLYLAALGAGVVLGDGRRSDRGAIVVVASSESIVLIRAPFGFAVIAVLRRCRSSAARLRSS